MAYQAWSVVFGEQPSAAKWNILGTNDASFNDGTGIGTNVLNDSTLKYGKVRSRQGGSSTNWFTQGTTTYDYSASNIFIQVGSISSPSAATKTVTFPTAFNQVPLVWVTVQSAVGANQVRNYVRDATTTQFTLGSLDVGTETCAWIAIGQ